ncbi:hypothetical protein PR048_026249 [Dryococelus australis]|uniref:Uncharacterized protein n=1 Tax=Dryococelus australis TaxID=614101 RepID=A0ABQ9GKT4_9NEOP|nr:hypothetical protein PR048_026249 [Dryococelus australis]
MLVSHHGEPGSNPGRVTPDFRKWESCRTMLSVGGFSRDLPFSPTFSFPRRSIPTSITLIGSQDLAVKSHHSLTALSALSVGGISTVHLDCFRALFMRCSRLASNLTASRSEILPGRRLQDTVFLRGLPSGTTNLRRGKSHQCTFPHAGSMQHARSSAAGCTHDHCRVPVLAACELHGLLVTTELGSFPLPHVVRPTQYGKKIPQIQDWRVGICLKLCLHGAKKYSGSEVELQQGLQKRFKSEARALESRPFCSMKAIHDKMSTFEINLREMSLTLRAYTLTGALSDMRPINHRASAFDLNRALQTESSAAYFTGATVVERLASSHPTEANRAQSAAGSPDFRTWESCRTMPFGWRVFSGISRLCVAGVDGRAAALNCTVAGRSACSHSLGLLDAPPEWSREPMRKKRCGVRSSVGMKGRGGGEGDHRRKPADNGNFRHDSHMILRYRLPFGYKKFILAKAVEMKDRGLKDSAFLHSNFTSSRPRNTTGLRSTLLIPPLASSPLRARSSTGVQSFHRREVSVEQRRNERAVETGNPRRNPPPTSGIGRHDPHLRKSGVNQKIYPDFVLALDHAISKLNKTYQLLRGKRESTEKTRRPPSTSATFLTREEEGAVLEQRPSAGVGG